MRAQCSRSSAGLSQSGMYEVNGLRHDCHIYSQPSYLMLLLSSQRTWRVGEKNGGGMAKGTKLFTLGIYSG
jgi:hypothetical protein